MINYDRKNQEMEMTCDECGDAETFYGEWKDCIAESKEYGWRTYKEGEEWMHKCPSCMHKRPGSEESFAGVRRPSEEIE